MCLAGLCIILGVSQTIVRKSSTLLGVIIHHCSHAFVLHVPGRVGSGERKFFLEMVENIVLPLHISHFLSHFSLCLHSSFSLEGLGQDFDLHQSRINV